MVRRTPSALLKALYKGLLKSIAISPDGNCLFASVTLALNHASAEHQQIINRVLDAHCIKETCTSITPQALRYHVVSKVLDKECALMNSACSQWIQIARSAVEEKDTVLLGEYSHVLPVLNCSDPDDLTAKERRVLFEEMAKNTFWGEQVCVALIQRITGVTLLIIDDNGHLLHQVDDDLAHNTLPSNPLFAILHLHGKHYQPICNLKTLVFDCETLPYIVAEQILESRLDKLLPHATIDKVKKIKHYLAVKAASNPHDKLISYV